MISKKMREHVEGSSVIRAMFEEGKRLAEQHGAENVYDFSLGNPSTPPPAEINDIINAILKDEKPTTVHGYMSNAGYEDVRLAVADSLNRKFAANLGAKNIIMTTGAAGGLNVILKTLLDPGDEVVVFAPFFSEYRIYVDNYGGKLVVISPNTADFQPNLNELEEKLTSRTKALIVNSPNNPTGVVYSEETVKNLAGILRRAQKKFGTDVYLLTDEPYRELAYDGVFVPYIPKYYENAIVGYSYSKSLSMPGDRIGWLAIPSEASDSENIIDGATVANRILGFVNAPSLIQRTVAGMLGLKTDVSGYDRNREAIYGGLLEAGYECVRPQGAFYLFVKSPIGDDREFCRLAKKYNILVVPGTAFACPGYFRIAYCVDYSVIGAALPKFRELMEEIRNTSR